MTRGTRCGIFRRHVSAKHPIDKGYDTGGVACMSHVLSDVKALGRVADVLHQCFLLFLVSRGMHRRHGGMGYAA